MNNYLESVKKFHASFNHPVEESIVDDNLHIRKLRLKLLYEEIEELSHAMGTDDTLHELCKETLLKEKNTEVYDKVETLDALCDIQYVLSGAIISMGYKNIFDDAFDEVQRSNMSKMCNSIEEAEDTLNYYKKERGEKLELKVDIKDDGKYIIVREDHKILKNVHYSPADLKKFIK